MSESSAAGNEKHGLRDRLTGALSRSYFLELLAHEKRIADRSGNPFVLCLVDVDELRGINDAVGQTCGDRVVAGLADRLRNLLDSPPWNETAYLHARFDGDALMLFIPGCSAEKAVRLAEALRARVAGTPLAGNVRATVSIGVAAYQPFESADRIVARTERALYLAKQFGRDRVEIAAAAPAERAIGRVIPFAAVTGKRRPRAS